MREHFGQPTDQTSSKGPGKSVSKTRRSLDRLIETELLYQESLKHKFPGLSVEVDARYVREIKRLGGEKNLRSALSCNNMNPDEFRKAIFRNLSIKRYLDKVIYSKIVIKETEVRKYYDENLDEFMGRESVHLRQIFVRGPKVDDDKEWRSVNEKALEIIRSARKGTSFINLARRYSDEPSGANDGGDMGVVQKGNLHSSFETVIFKLDDGAISEPLKSRHGIHIFNVVKRTPSTVMPFELIKDKLHTKLRKKRAQEMVRQLLHNLKARADIQIVGQGGQ